MYVAHSQAQTEVAPLSSRDDDISRAARYAAANDGEVAELSGSAFPARHLTTDRIAVFIVTGALAH